MAQDKNFNYDLEKEAFEKTFEILYSSMMGESFRRYDAQKNRFLGGFLVSAYEVIALGIGYNHDSISQTNIDIRERIKKVWMQPDYTSSSGTGVSAQRRIQKIVPLGREIFRP